MCIPLSPTIYQSPVETRGDCCGSVAEHWWLKARGVLGSVSGGCRPFHFLYFCLTISKFIYFQCESRCSEYSSMLSLPQSAIIVSVAWSPLAIWSIFCSLGKRHVRMYWFWDLESDWLDSLRDGDFRIWTRFLRRYVYFRVIRFTLTPTVCMPTAWLRQICCTLTWKLL